MVSAASSAVFIGQARSLLDFPFPLRPHSLSAIALKNNYTSPLPPPSSFHRLRALIRLLSEALSALFPKYLLSLGIKWGLCSWPFALIWNLFLIWSLIWSYHPCFVLSGCNVPVSVNPFPHIIALFFTIWREQRCFLCFEYLFYLCRVQISCLMFKYINHVQ